MIDAMGRLGAVTAVWMHDNWVWVGLSLLMMYGILWSLDRRIVLASHRRNRDQVQLLLAVIALCVLLFIIAGSLLFLVAGYLNVWVPRYENVLKQHNPDSDAMPVQGLGFAGTLASLFLAHRWGRALFFDLGNDRSNARP